MDRLMYSLRETSRLLGIPVVTLRYFCKTKKIKGVRVGYRWYLAKKEIDKFIEKGGTR